MKKKKRIPTWLIVVLCIILYIVLNFGFIIGIFLISFFTTDENMKYTEENGIIKVKNKDITVETIDGKYINDGDNCFIINAKIKANLKKKLISPTNLDIEYTLYDEDGYEVGTTIISINNLYDYNKWNKTASYCEGNEVKVADYKLTKISMY